MIGSWLCCAVFALALIAALLSAPAEGAGFEAKTSRQPLPARQVERPILIPKGWTDIEVSMRVDRPWAKVARAQDRLMIRRGLLPRHELFLSMDLDLDATMGWRWSIFRAEPPMTAVALESSWSAPGIVQTGLALRRQVGGLRLTGRGAGIVRYEDPQVGGLFSVEALLQAGLLVFAATPVVHLAPGTEPDAAVGLRGTIQWTRGFDTSVMGGVAVLGAPRDDGVELRLGARF